MSRLLRILLVSSRPRGQIICLQEVVEGGIIGGLPTADVIGRKTSKKTSFSVWQMLQTSLDDFGPLGSLLGVRIGLTSKWNDPPFKHFEELFSWSWLASTHGWSRPSGRPGRPGRPGCPGLHTSDRRARGTW